MNTYKFKYETATYAPGETETLDPVTIAGTDRADAELGMADYVNAHGGHCVRCESCSETPLLVGETVCAVCAACGY